MLFSIIIISYNSEKNILPCLTSINNNCHAKIEIIIIDNAFKDRIAKIIKRRFSQVKFTENRINVGFAKAANQGARIAKGEYLLFLNPDTVVKKNCIEEMIKFLESKKDAVVVGCKLLNPTGSLQPSCGNFPTISNIILDRIPIINKLFKTEIIRQENYYQSEQSPDWISGGFFLVRRDIFLELGGFDEKYFMYVEDIDFCYRVKEKGYKIYYNPDVEIVHYDMGRSKERKVLKSINMRKGFSMFFKKYKYPLYYSLWQAILRIEAFLKTFLKIKQ